MTSPESPPESPVQLAADAPAGSGPPPRSGSGIVIAMLLGMVVILWTFDLVVSAFGPPEAGMSISFVNGSEADWRVLVCGEPDNGWAALFASGAPGGRLEPGAERALHLIVERGRVWTLALIGGDPARPTTALLDLRADPDQQLVLELRADGEPVLREGPALISHARRHMLEERPRDDWTALRSRVLLPEVPSAGVPLPDAPDAWSFGPPTSDA